MVGSYKHNGRVQVPLKPSPNIQKDDRPDTGTCGPTGLFSEDCDPLHPGSTQGNFKKEFGAPVYDEYEEEYLHIVPQKLAIEPRPADGEDQDAMRNQEVKVEKGNKDTKGDNLPLCYASFELIWHMIKASNKNKK